MTDGLLHGTPRHLFWAARMVAGINASSRIAWSNGVRAGQKTPRVAAGRLGLRWRKEDVVQISISDFESVCVAVVSN
jgi:hypothetical protein